MIPDRTIKAWVLKTHPGATWAQLNLIGEVLAFGRETPDKTPGWWVIGKRDEVERRILAGHNRPA